MKCAHHDFTGVIGVVDIKKLNRMEKLKSEHGSFKKSGENRLIALLPLTFTITQHMYKNGCALKWMYSLCSWQPLSIQFSSSYNVFATYMYNGENTHNVIVVWCIVIVPKQVKHCGEKLKIGNIQENIQCTALQLYILLYILLWMPYCLFIFYT